MNPEEEDPMSEERPTEFFEVEHDGKTFLMNDEILIDELTYSNYRYNRQLNPEISPQEWGDSHLFPQWERYESRYQSERRHAQS